VAAALRRIQGLDVEVIDGGKGEFAVLVDEQEVARKGETLPSVQEVVTSVKEMALSKQSV
jgi:hypothetical protein